MARTMTILVALALLLYAAAGLALFVFQRSLIFAGDKTDLDPAQLGLPEATIHHLRTADDVDLVSWLVRGSGERIAIYFHGNGGSLAGRAERIQDLNRLGLSVLAIDYRGYGGSGGSPSELGFRKDADAAYAFARGLGFAAHHLILYGESLGSGVALELASRKMVGGIILDSPFSSIADVAADRYWMFPVRLLLKDPFRSDLAIAKIRAPILILHGERDTLVPIKYGQRLSRFGGDNVSFVPVASAGHVVFDLESAQAQVASWMTKTFGADIP